LIVSLQEDGDIFGCEVAHSALQHKNFSSIGTIKTNDFEYADGQVKGELTTDGQAEIFGETWGVNVKFVAPLGEIPKEFQPAASKEEEKPTSTESSKKAAASDSDNDDDDENDDASAQPKAAGLNVKDLALTKDASDVEYKALVEQLGFKSKTNVNSACAELSANLKAQGWTKQGGDLITPASAILKRKRDGAELTIFVKPEGGGSEVKMMTEGLAWDEK
jgi:flagellar hook-associated protein FlgK